MNILKQLFLIFFLCLIGAAIAIILPISFPSSVISLLMLFILMALKVVKPDQISKVSEFLLGTMALYFIPAGVAIMEKYDLIRSSLIPLIAITLITTILTFGATGYTTLFFIRQIEKKEARKHD